MLATPLVLPLLSALAAASPDADNPSFRRDVLPILSDRCFACHGPDGGARKAKLRLDAKIIERRKEGIANWIMHDIRRSGATHMAEAGVPPQVLAAILSHSPGSVQGVTSIYNRFRYTKERRMALEAWANYLESLGVDNRETKTA